MSEPDAGDVELSRDLGFLAVLTTAMGTMIGAGIFVLPGVAAANAGPAASLSFLIAGVIAAMATLSAAELSTAMPKAGGSYYFVSRGMGALVGTIVGLGAWLSLVLKGSFALVGLGQYVLYFSPVPVMATALVGGVLLVLVNWLGAGVSGTLQNVVVVLLLAILGVFVARGLFAIDRGLLTPYVHFSWTSVTATTGIVFISYLGIVKATAIAEEVEDPGRNIPLGMLTAVGVVTVLYVLVMTIVTGTLPIAGIGEREAPLADTAQVFLGGVGGALVGLSGILATTSTGNAAVLASARFPFAMARDGLMSPKLNEISERFGTPSRALWLTGGFMLALVVLFDVEALAKLGGTFGILVFALLNVSVLVLRQARPPWYEPEFVAPLYPWVQIVGALAALALIPQMGLLSQLSALAFVALGGVWFLLQRARRPGVRPDYGLVDQLSRVREVRAIEAKRQGLERPTAVSDTVGEHGSRPKVVVELVEGHPHERVLAIAAALAREHDAWIEALVVAEVPEQVPLFGYPVDVDFAWRDEVQDRLAALDVEADLHHLVTHDRDRALLARVDEDTSLVLVDGGGPPGSPGSSARRREAVLAQRRVPAAVYRHGAEEGELAHVMVATSGGPYERLEVEAADAIATAHGARLTFLRVLAEDAAEERVRNAESYLHELGELVSATSQVRLVRADDAGSAIVEAGREADLLVAGAAPRTGVGPRGAARWPQQLASGIETSVVVVKDPEPEASWWEAVIDRFTGDR